MLIVYFGKEKKENGAINSSFWKTFADLVFSVNDNNVACYYAKFAPEKSAFY